MPSPTRTGLPNPASYTEHAVDGTVTDNVTGLSWQGAVEPTTVYTQGQAIRHCDGEGAGWRLPTRVELFQDTERKRHYSGFTSDGRSVR